MRALKSVLLAGCAEPSAILLEHCLSFRVCYVCLVAVVGRLDVRLPSSPQHSASLLSHHLGWVASTCVSVNLPPT